jgi:TPR repeat protein
VFQRLADAGYGKAYFARFNLYGRVGVDHDEDFQYDRSMHYAKLAFDWCFSHQFQGEPDIWQDLENLYQLDKDEDWRYVEYWLEDAAVDGMPEAQYELASFLINNNREEEALHWMEAASEQDFRPAKIWLAIEIEEVGLAENVRQTYIEEGIAWFIEHCKKGEAHWQYKYATLHLCRHIPEANREAGMHWLSLSAEQNYPDACLDLGRLILKSSTNNESIKDAVQLLGRASKSGKVKASEELANLYLHGITDANGQQLYLDSDAAIFWLKKASMRSEKARSGLSI